ncbi:MAG: triphosphoribosyl-dephospho-CoA synthase CitG [Lachnospiraceae bacterium]|nr:triphosphoribosyl-dephospho-CoA synthase CitG [Lachnospiraceae bacterium]
MEHPVILQEMLDARERRAFRQQELRNQYQAPLICFTMNIAGPIKTNPLIRQGFELGNRLLKNQLRASQITCLHYEETTAVTGNEAFYVLDADLLSIKRITSDIEDCSPVGRLFDMDVISVNGEITGRSEIGLSPRLCLICGKPAKECARSRTHTVEELQAKTKQILEEAINTADAKDAAQFACRALLYEVGTTPKPGLVDCANSGSHTDMDIFTFMNSASALWPYFESCTRIGRQTADCPAVETFRQLRRTGRRAEADMLAATNGVNTHKGAIFSMGILCAALGRVPRVQWNHSDVLLEECAAMTSGLVQADFDGLTEENARTTGQKLYLHHQITGIRGQMERGMPAVRFAGFPTLKRCLAHGLSLNDAGCIALLNIMSSSTDTNLIARSSLTVQQETVSQIRTLLADNPYPDMQTIQKIDQEFMKMNLSPGGSADLLAICYLLYFLENEV